jgi:hypothetical protein
MAELMQRRGNTTSIVSAALLNRRAIRLKQLSPETSVCVLVRPGGRYILSGCHRSGGVEQLIPDWKTRAFLHTAVTEDRFFVQGQTLPRLPNLLMPLLLNNHATMPSVW